MNIKQYVAFISNGKALDAEAIQEVIELEEHDQVIQASECNCTHKEHLSSCEIQNVVVEVESAKRKLDKYIVEMAFCKECVAYYIPQKSYEYLSKKGSVMHHIKGGIRLFEYLCSGDSYDEEVAQFKKINGLIRTAYSSLPKVVSKYQVDDGCGGLYDLQSQKDAAEAVYKKQDELNGLAQSPYHGRIDVSDSKKNRKTYYIGGAEDKFIGNFHVYSGWSEQGRLFTRTNEPKGSIDGVKRDVNLRRKIDIVSGKLRGIEDVFSDNSEFAEQGIYDKFLIQVLMTRKKSHQLTDIIATIQENQNEIIEKAYVADIIVQGCAGSGKTMVLLHRLSYWLYNNKSLSTDKIKILTPNENFNIHIGNLHSQLKLGHIEILSVDQYYSLLLDKYDKELSYHKKVTEEGDIEERFLNYIYSKTFAKVLQSAYRSVLSDYCTEDEYVFVKRCADKCGYEFQYHSHGTVAERVSDLGRAIRATVDISSSVHSELSRFEERIQKNQEEREKAQITIKGAEDEVFRMEKEYQERLRIFCEENISKNQTLLTQYTEQAAAVTEEINRLGRGLRRVFQGNEIRKEQEKYEHLEELIDDCGSEIAAWETLKAEMEQAESVETVQEIFNRQKLGKEGDSIREYLLTYKKRKRVIYDQKLIIERLENEIQRDQDHMVSLDVPVTKEKLKKLRTLEEKYSKDASLKIFNKIYERATSEKLIELNLEKSDKVYRCVLFARLQFAILYWEKMVGEDELICIDEGQDMSFREYELIVEQNKQNRAHYNVYGDLNQRIKRGRGLVTWEQLKRKLLAHEYLLNENYRNTNQITQYCNDVFHFDMTLTGVEGDPVRNITFSEMMDEVAALKADGERVAIILPRTMSKQRVTRGKAVSAVKDKLSVKFDPAKISVMYVDEIKGIEFDRVYVVDEDMERNERYIAFTRALDKLAIVH